MANIEIGGRLHSTATGNVVTGANEVLDDAKNKKQSVINAEVDETIGDDNTEGTIKGRIKTAEGKLDTLNGDSSTSGSVAKAVADAKTELIGGATSDGNTLKKVEDRTATLETAVGSNGSVDQRIAAAKSEVIGDAASDYNTLGKLEDKIQAEASARESAVSTEAQARQDAITAETNRATTRENQIYDLVHTPEQHYVTVATYADLANIASPSDDTVYRVSSYNGNTSQVDNTVYSEYGYDGTNFVFLCVKSQIDEVYDISAHHSNNTYVDLAAALDGGNNIPQELRRGGMSVKFVQSSDNKYIQFRCMANAFTTDTTQWQGVDDEPTVGSNNLVKSGSIFCSSKNSKISFDELYPNVVQRLGINLITNIETGKWLSSADGKKIDTSDQNYTVSNYIEIKNTTKFLYIGNLVHPTSICFYYNTVGQKTSFAGYFSTSQNTNIEISNIPVNAKYIRVGAYKADNFELLSIQEDYGNSVLSYINGINSQLVKDMYQRQYYAGDELITTEIVQSGKWQSNTGALIQHENTKWKVTNFIPLNNIKKLSYTGFLENPTCIVFYKDRVHQSSLVTGYISGSGQTFIDDIVIPDNSKYVVAATYGDGEFSLKVKEIYGLTPITANLDFDNTLTTNNPIEIIKPIRGFGSIIKDWGFIGDSLSSGWLDATNSNNYEYSWGQRMCSLLGVTGYNFSTGGQTTAGWLGNGGAAERRWEGAKTNPKKGYTIALGVNDYNRGVVAGDISTDVGVYDYTTDTDTNADTFAGHYAGIIQRIQSIVPNAKIFVITLPEGSVEYNTVIREMPTIFSNVFVIDLNKYAPSMSAISEMRTVYFNGGHMTVMGYEYMSWLIANYIDWIIKNNYSAFKNIGTY